MNAKKKGERKVTVAYLARKAFKQIQPEFAARIGVHRITQARRERADEIPDLARHLYRLLMGAKAAGLNDLIDRATNYEAPKSEEKTFIRLVSELLIAGKASLIQQAISSTSESPISEEGIQMEHAMPILGALRAALKREARDTGAERLKKAADGLDAAILQVQAHLQEEREKKAIEEIPPDEEPPDS